MPTKNNGFDPCESENYNRRMYLLINIAAVLAFIASVMVGYYTYSKFAVLDKSQFAGLSAVFVVLTAIWVGGRIWMLLNQHRNPKRR